MICEKCKTEMKAFSMGLSKDTISSNVMELTLLGIPDVKIGRLVYCETCGDVKFESVKRMNDGKSATWKAAYFKRGCYYCSECDFMANEEERTDTCPNCLAKMNLKE